jgi:hypothetical protein
MRVVAAAVAGLTALALAGCGSGRTVTVTRLTATTPSGSATTVTSSQPPLATRDGGIDGKPAALAILTLKRSGQTVELTIAVSTTSTSQVQIGEAFDDGIGETVGGGSTVAGLFTMDGVYLVDTTNAKKYPVGRDPSGQCLCETNLNNAFVTAGAPLVLSATFGAPPPTVSRVNVSIPNFGTFVNVPLS